MRVLPKPAHDPATVFLSCVSGMKQGDLKTRLLSVVPLVAAAGADYDTAAEAPALHTLAPEEHVGAVKAEEMARLYEKRMVKSGLGRRVYDELKSLPPNERCPLCGVGVVSTLDHHLPKAEFPALAVNPRNLVPACKDCNVGKRAARPMSEGEQTLHPYFDTFFATARWLHADVVQTAPAALRFYPLAPPEWPAVWAERVKRHFTVFNLQRVYASNAAQELVSIRHQLKALHTQSGAQGVQRELLLRAQSAEAAELNAWRTALYWALSASSWFYSEGFALQ